MTTPLNFPFDPALPDYDQETATLTWLLQNNQRETMRKLRVCLPCEVVKIRGNQLVDLQPLLQVHYVTNTQPTTLRVLPNCPVSMPMGQDWSMRYPLAVGDTGYAIFCDRALDTWAEKGGVVDPADPRTHDLSDAIFVPGLVPHSQQTQETDDDFVIRNGTAQVRLEKNGTFRIANQGQELVDLVGQLVQATAALTQTMQAALTNTMLGPQPFLATTQSSLSQGLATVNQIAADLATLKGL